MIDIKSIQNYIQPFLDFGKYEEALQVCIDSWQNNPQKNDPGVAWLVLMMARIYYMGGDYNHSARFFDLASSLAEGNNEILRRVDLFKKLTQALPSSRTDIENLCDPDIVLVQAPGWGINTPPLGTAMLSAYARKHGYKVLPVDLNLEFYLNRPDEFKQCWELEQSLWFWNTTDSVNRLMEVFEEKIESFIDLIISSNTKAVGFTIYDSSLKISLELARRLKNRKPEIKIIFGGPHVSRFMAGNSLILNEYVDAAAQGEGELVLVELLKRITAGKDFSDCSGLLVAIDGKLVDNGDRELIKNLNEVPAPDFSDFSFELYRTPTRLPLMSSRGCVNQCIFCNERPFWKRYRFRTAENVFAEVQTQLERYPFINFLDFQDSLVNGAIHEMERFADLINQSGIKVQWSGQAVIRKEMTEELMVKLKKSGCVCMAYGLETSSSQLMLKVGKIASKGADVNAIAEAHRKSGLGAVYNVMFGLPGETEEDSFETLEFLRRNYRTGLTVNPSPAFCGFSLGTLGYENPIKYGIDFSKGSMYWESVDGQNTFLRRLKRFEDFCRLANELGVQTTYPATHLLDRDRTLGKYFLSIGDNVRAKYYLEQWLTQHNGDQEIKALLEEVVV